MKYYEDELAKIDIAHAEFIKGLTIASKPDTILELGLGGGRSTEAILDGLRFNQKPYKFTLVDNWVDRGGVIPVEAVENYGKDLEIVTMDEREFVFSCQGKYDLIMSDADHFNTEKWFEYVYENLLNDGGVLMYHDINIVTEEFINLRQIYYKCQEYNLKHVLFNKNSLPEERCQRGLLVIFK